MADSEQRRGDWLAEQLEALILGGEYPRRLPSERTLAQRYGVSRATVREAIGLLVARGLLTRRHGAGTYVNSQDERPMAEIWADMASRHPRLQESLIEFRAMLECRTAELAAVRHDATDRGRLRAAAQAVDAAYAGSDRKAQIECDIQLHRSIADATHNPVFSYLMASLLSLLHDHVQLSIAGLAPGSDEALALRGQHRALIDAILARDEHRAGEVARGHMAFVGVMLNHLHGLGGLRPSR